MEGVWFTVNNRKGEKTKNKSGVAVLFLWNKISDAGGFAQWISGLSPNGRPVELRSGVREFLKEDFLRFGEELAGDVLPVLVWA